MKAFRFIYSLSFQRKLALGFLGASLGQLLSPCPGLSAEQIILSYGVIQQSISVDTLEDYTETAELEAVLSYGQHAGTDQLKQLQQVLKTPIFLDTAQVSRFLHTPMGEQLLGSFALLIQSNHPETALNSIRDAIVLAAAEPEGLTLLNILRKFPASEVEIDLARGLELVNRWNEFSQQTQQAIAQIRHQAASEAMAQPLPPSLPDVDLQKQGRSSWKRHIIRLNDRSRNRSFPADIYLPSATTPRPLIVISHGLNSDRFSFTYLAEHLASHGFAVAALEHPGSNWEQLVALYEGRVNQMMHPREFVDRPLDVTYLLNELDRLSRTASVFQGRLNLKQVGVAGQSLGGYTALVLAGAKPQFEQLRADCSNWQNSFNLSLLLQCGALELSGSASKLNSDLADPRVQAVIAISPVGSSLLRQTSLQQISIPLMMIASGNDLMAPVLPEQIQPFTHLTAPEKYLVLLNGATHFSTVTQPAAIYQSQPDPMIARSYVNALSTAFLQTHVADQADYQAYLNAAYANTLSQESLPLNLVQSLALPQATHASNHFSLNGLLIFGISAQTVAVIYWIAVDHRSLSQRIKSWLKLVTKSN